MTMNVLLFVAQISGTPECVENAKEAILERCKQLEVERQNRLLRSYELKVILLQAIGRNFAP